MLRAKDTDAALRKANQALAFGDAAVFRFTRAAIDYRLRRWGEALNDLDCGLALAP